MNPVVLNFTSKKRPNSLPFYESFNIYISKHPLFLELLGAYYVPGTVLEAGLLMDIWVISSALSVQKVLSLTCLYFSAHVHGQGFPYGIHSGVES